MPGRSTASQAAQDLLALGSRNGLELANLPRVEKTIGKVITQLRCADLIDGVQLEPLQVSPMTAASLSNSRAWAIPASPKACSHHARLWQTEGIVDH